MQTILIAGGNRLEREKKIFSLLESYSVAIFDLYDLGEEGSIGIEKVRNIHHELVLKSYTSQNRAIVIHDAEKVTLEAQNALLKILEEPPPNTYIILSIQNPNLLLPTILSRCQVIQLKVKVTIAHNPAEFIQLLNLLTAGSIGESINAAGIYGSSKEEAQQYLNDTVNSLRMLLKNHYIHTPRKDRFDPSFITELTKKFIRASQFIENNTNPRLTLEVLFLSIAKKSRDIG